MAILSSSCTVVMVALFLLASSASAQPSCASNLVGCQPFLGGTSKPPQTCCGPLQSAIETQLSCLCSIYDSPGLLQAFNISLTDALALPKRCDITGDSSCNSAAAPSNTPPATPGDNGNAAHGLAWIGMSGLTSLFVLLWSIMA